MFSLTGKVRQNAKDNESHQRGRNRHRPVIERARLQDAPALMRKIGHRSAPVPEGRSWINRRLFYETAISARK
jgi:hypothetical protein